MENPQLQLIGYLKELYSQNVNLIQWMNSNENFKDLSVQEKALLSYDIQAGSYTNYYQDEDVASLKRQGGEKIANILNNLDVSTVLEAGTGEATTLRDIILRSRNNISFGAFDISFSRVLYAQKFLISKGISLSHLFISDMLNIALANNSTDLILTFHAIEPNGGKEDDICRELHRVTRKYVLLIEPSWEFANSYQKNRMQEHGYIKNLPGALKTNGFSILLHEPWGLDVEPSNVAAMILAEKNNRQSEPLNNNFQYVYPSTDYFLRNIPDGFYCEELGILFPIFNQIPCLLSSYGVLATRYLEASTTNNK